MIHKISVMFKKLKPVIGRIAANESGMVLQMVLGLFLLASLVILPLTGFVSTGLKSSPIYEDKKKEYYAADAGIQDAVLQIRYGYLKTIFVNPAYSLYDYGTVWEYDLPQQVNNENVSIDIQNVWVPSNIPVPSQAAASGIIGAEKLVVTDSADLTTGKITITYFPGPAEDLRIETVGVWLPRGFTYVTGSSNLEADPYATSYAVASVQSHQGSQAALWTFNSVSIEDFPGADPQQYPMTSEITFEFTSSQPGAMPNIVGWVTTSGVADIPFSYAADTGVYKITSQAGNTIIDAYTLKEEIRNLRSAISGDYKAIGNSLMIDVDHDAVGIRDQLLPSSDAAVNTIPGDANVAAAILYWSGWQNNGRMQTLLSDTCSNFNNWNNGSVWSVYSNRFRGHYNSGDDSVRNLTLINSHDLSSYTAGTVKVSWDQWVSALADIFSDSCSNLDNWINGSAWSESSNRFRGRYSSGADSVRYLTMENSQNLSSYAGETVKVSWDQWVSSTPLSTDGLDFAFSADGGASWSSNFQAFRGNIGGSPVNFSYTIPAQYLTSGFKMRFYLVGFNGSPYSYIDNIKITSSYSDADGLDFAFSADGGATWSNNFQAFGGNIGGSAVNFSYTVPTQYMTAGFKMKFYLAGFSGSGEYANIDNIKIVVMPADTSIIFSVNGNQVYFDGNGQPAQGAQPITADRTQVFANAGGGIGGFSYASSRDVTDLVRTFSAKAPDPAVNHPGNGTYTVGDVLGDTGTQLAYAGWSLIIVYTSVETQGHQLYLYDKFMYSPGSTDIDFDNDGFSGGFISGFIVPVPVQGEVNAATLTVFVGEGDDHYEGDFIAFNAPDNYQSNPQNIPDSYKLWDGIYSVKVPGSNTPSHADNVWNGMSLGLTADGVDIDTFNVTWASGMLQPGDTSARINMYTQIDNWNLVYIIISFRSSVITGNILSYKVR